MSFAFQQFLSTLGATANSGNNSNNGLLPSSVEGNKEMATQQQDSLNIDNLDMSGGFAPVLLFDPAMEDMNNSVPKTLRGDSPGISSSLNKEPMVFSKATDFISATLSSVKVGAGTAITPTSSGMLDDDNNVCIPNSGGIMVDDLTRNSELNQAQILNLVNETSGASNTGCVNSNNSTVGNTGIDNEQFLKNMRLVSIKDAVDDDYTALDKRALKISNIVDENSSDSNKSVPANEDKIWRKGMEKKSGENTNKTMFISQNLTKMYDKADAQIKSLSYDVSAAKILREIVYFEKMLHVTSEDLKNSEHTRSTEHVLITREKIKDKVETMLLAVQRFLDETLKGPVRTEAASIQHPSQKEEVEYVHAPEKKSAKEAKAELCLENVDVANSLHKCVDCGLYVVVDEGEDLESAFEKHANSSEHMSICESEDSSGVKISKLQPKERIENNGKKVLEKVPRQNVLNHTQSRQMMLNQIISHANNTESQVMFTCNPCGDVLAAEAFSTHVNNNTHKDNLNNYNIRLQKDLMIKYPDLFGPGKTFHLTDLHIVMNKIFVDPLAKYTYCGLCRKELPSKQLNIDEHITSKYHEKLLLASMEGKVSKVQHKDNDQSFGNKMRNMHDNLDNISKSDNSENIRLRSAQDRRSSGNIQPYDMEEKDKVYGATSIDGKFVCLLCDARGITSVQNLVSHFNGGPHKTNLEHSKSPRGDVDSITQFRLIRNMVCVSYGRSPLVAECLACHTPPFSSIQAAVEHTELPSHIGMLLSKQREHKSQQTRERTERRPSVATSVILHRNGVNFWCLSCRCELQDIVTAYRHVLLPGHSTPSVDGVLMLQSTQFHCDHCNVFINSEKNVGQHIISQKHRQQVVAPATKMNLSREARTPPTMSRAHAKKLEDECTDNKSAHSCDDGKLKLEERILLHKNFINILKKNLFQCKICDSEQMNRAKILTHIFCYDHVVKMQNKLFSPAN